MSGAACAAGRGENNLQIDTPKKPNEWLCVIYTPALHVQHGSSSYMMWPNTMLPGVCAKHTL